MGRDVKHLNPQQEINATDEANVRQEATLQELEQRRGDYRLGGDRGLPGLSNIFNVILHHSKFFLIPLFEVIVRYNWK
jgi:hypothetical protein